MKALFIGQSSFLANAIHTAENTVEHYSLGHEKALLAGNWPHNANVVINFATEPRVRDGSFSNLDHKYARIAKERGAAYIMLSSRTVYGIPEDPAEFLEQTPPHKTMLPYGHAKRLIEEDLIQNFDHVTILRLSNIFGFEYNPNQPRPTFLGVMLKNLKESGTITFNMSSQTQRDFLPVSIFTDWLNIILRDPQPGIYNLGAGFGTAVGDIAKWVIEGYGTGRLKNTKPDVIDSFVLNMAHTRKTYSLPRLYSDNIRTACLDIGKKLKDIS
jgi:nucleoside-diphosphate-sugar epimerase